MIRREISGTESNVNIMVQVDMKNADPVSLDIGNFWTRHPEGIYWTTGRGVSDTAIDKKEVGAMVFHMTYGAQVVGAIPSFDTRGLENILAVGGFLPLWHHRLICVESLTAGYLSNNVGGLASCAAALGVEQDPATEHTAMGDADLAKRIYDHIMEDK